MLGRLDRRIPHAGVAVPFGVSMPTVERYLRRRRQTNAEFSLENGVRSLIATGKEIDSCEGFVLVHAA